MRALGRAGAWRGGGKRFKKTSSACELRRSHGPRHDGEHCQCTRTRDVARMRSQVKAGAGVRSRSRVGAQCGGGGIARCGVERAVGWHRVHARHAPHWPTTCAWVCEGRQWHGQGRSSDVRSEAGGGRRAAGAGSSALLPTRAENRMEKSMEMVSFFFFHDWTGVWLCGHCNRLLHVHHGGVSNTAGRHCAKFGCILSWRRRGNGHNYTVATLSD